MSLIIPGVAILAFGFGGGVGQFWRAEVGVGMAFVGTGAVCGGDSSGLLLQRGVATGRRTGIRVVGYRQGMGEWAAQLPESLLARAVIDSGDCGRGGGRSGINGRRRRII